MTKKKSEKAEKSEPVKVPSREEEDARLKARAEARQAG